MSPDQFEEITGKQYKAK
ncbi:hypothetical protein M5W87_17800 [Paenibacillus apiarius]|uniref:Uncharacterized protein n=1 Tax=Paenibacillus apiarius TaxID=46240 RepID=A0ABT4DS53_9BACL|nr:hypothetical protein [Paenibacillus apiarius]MCY9514263.1 hypothetical protein [Paenibacillus apiarius]MCY9520154.1 hypothetical protein [Paenibacillus apiarius]MCY9550161.1 hypothetical protein [Paenibacillus apiarius]MCY9560228.1 hypothetical protein [Paenibacillus apiarius]MCY9683126.1 hypothetical protein [Paenibacillus apiarius]